MAITNTTRGRDFAAGSPSGASVAAFGNYWNVEFDRLYANDVELQALITALTPTVNNSVQLTGAQTVAGAKTWEDAAVFESTAQIDGAADLNSTLDVQGAANFQSTAAFTGETTHTGEIQADGGMDVASGQVIRHNNTPVAGYLDDGTPFYRKRLTGAFASGAAGTVNLAHGLGSIYTNQRVIAASVAVDPGSTHYWYPSFDSSSAAPAYFVINDTNLVITRLTTGGVANNVIAHIDYIL